MQLLVRLVALALACALGTNAANAGESTASDEEQRYESAFREYKIALAERLSVDPDPRRRMAAAILIKVEAQLAAASRAHPDSDDFTLANFPASLDLDELVGSALTQAPDDPLLLWIAATNCPASAATCEPHRALDRLRELQSDNAMVWLHNSANKPLPGRDVAVQALPDGRDTVDEDARLRRIASATRVDGFHWDIQRMLLDAFLQRPLPDELLEASDFATPTQEKLAVMAAIGYEMAFVAPHWGQVSELCGLVVINAKGESRRELCIAALSNINERADTLLAKRLALSRLLQLLPEGEARDATLAEQHRNDWQMTVYFELLPPDTGGLPQADAEAERHITNLRRAGTTEMTAMREGLIAAGIPLDPPDDWTSPHHQATTARSKSSVE